MIAGQKDAASLLGIGAGLLSANPLLAGSGLAAAGLAGTLGGSAWLSWKSMSRAAQQRMFASARDGFTLPSDTPGPLYYGNGGYRVGLTRGRNEAVDVSDDVAMRHLGIIGQSGVGKTVLGQNLLWQQTARGGGWIFVDAKLDRDTRDQLGYMMRIMGREQDYYVFDSSDPANSNTYNPLLRGSGDEVASRLLNLLPVAEENPGADHYRQAANYALSVIIRALQACGMAYHFGDLSILLQSPAALQDLEFKVSNLPGDKAREASSGLRVFLDQYRSMGKEGPQIDMKRLKDTLGGMAGRIATFAQGDFGAVMNHTNPEIDLPDIMLNNKCLYVMLPTMAKDTAALNLGKMYVSDMRSAVAIVQDQPKHRRPNPPFMAFLDEMGSYVMYGVKTLFEQARSAQIMMVPGFQAFANLTVVTEDFAEILIQNTWSKALYKFGSRDAEEAAEIIGKANRYAESLSEGDNLGVKTPVMMMRPDHQQTDATTFGSSYQQAEEYRVSPDKLRALPKGQCLFQSGSRIYHLASPMVQFPNGIEPFTVTRRNPALPKGLKNATYASEFYNFLTEGQEKQMKEDAEQQGKEMAAEDNKKQRQVKKNNEDHTERNGGA